MKFRCEIPIAIIMLLMMTGCSSTRTYQKVNQVIYPEKRLPESIRTIKVGHLIPEISSTRTVPNPSLNSSADIKETERSEFGSEGEPGYLVNQTIREMKTGQYYLIEQNNIAQNEILSWDDGKAKNYLQNGQQALLVLTHLDSDYDFKSEKIRKHQLDASGNDYYIDAFEANRNYLVRAEWNIYHGEPVDVIYKYVNSGEQKVTTQGLNPDHTIQKLDSIAQGTVRFLLDSLARDVTVQIMPRKIFDSWTYYVKGSEELENGRRYMEIDKLEEATKIYLNGLKSRPDAKTEARLSYNLAVINDILGDADQAFLFAEQAVLADNKYLHQNLYNELKLKREISER